MQRAFAIAERVARILHPARSLLKASPYLVMACVILVVLLNALDAVNVWLWFATLIGTASSLIGMGLGSITHAFSPRPALDDPRPLYATLQPIAGFYFIFAAVLLVGIGLRALIVFVDMFLLLPET